MLRLRIGWSVAPISGAHSSSLLTQPASIPKRVSSAKSTLRLRLKLLANITCFTTEAIHNFLDTLEISTGSQRLRDFRFPELGSAALPTGDYSSPPPDGKFVVSIASVTDSLGNWITPALLKNDSSRCFRSQSGPILNWRSVIALGDFWQGSVSHKVDSPTFVITFSSKRGGSSMMPTFAARRRAISHLMCSLGHFGTALHLPSSVCHFIQHSDVTSVSIRKRRCIRPQEIDRCQEDYLRGTVDDHSPTASDPLLILTDCKESPDRSVRTVELMLAPLAAKERGPNRDFLRRRISFLSRHSVSQIVRVFSNFAFGASNTTDKRSPTASLPPTVWDSARPPRQNTPSLRVDQKGPTPRLTDRIPLVTLRK